MRLIALFLLLSVLAAAAIDRIVHPPSRWHEQRYVRIEGRNCPLYVPADAY